MSSGSSSVLAFGEHGKRVTAGGPFFMAVQGGKLWYIDRMVLLFEEMKTRDPEYARWEY
jgi:hypothetical protein